MKENAKLYDVVALTVDLPEYKLEGLDNFRVGFLAEELVFSQRDFPLGDEI